MILSGGDLHTWGASGECAVSQRSMSAAGKPHVAGSFPITNLSCSLSTDPLTSHQERL